MVQFLEIVLSTYITLITIELKIRLMNLGEIKNAKLLNQK